MVVEPDEGVAAHHLRRHVLVLQAFVGKDRRRLRARLLERSETGAVFCRELIAALPDLLPLRWHERAQKRSQMRCVVAENRLRTRWQGIAIDVHFFRWRNDDFHDLGFLCKSAWPLFLSQSRLSA